MLFARSIQISRPNNGGCGIYFDWIMAKLVSSLYITISSINQKPATPLPKEFAQRRPFLGFS
jgi:hypothetical protein